MTLNVLSLLAALAFATAPPPSIFGEAPTAEETAALADVLKEPSKFAGRDVVLEGTVGKVCQKKGCWLTLKDAGKDIRITFKDYAFFAPKDCAGKRVRAQGRVEEVTLSVREARHFLKDEGAPREELKKVKAPVKTVSFVASGLQLLNPNLP